MVETHEGLKHAMISDDYLGNAVILDRPHGHPSYLSYYIPTCFGNT